MKLHAVKSVNTTKSLSLPLTPSVSYLWLVIFLPLHWPLLPKFQSREPIFTNLIKQMEIYYPLVNIFIVLLFNLTQIMQLASERKQKKGQRIYNNELGNYNLAVFNLLSA